MIGRSITAKPKPGAGLHGRDAHAYTFSRLRGLHGRDARAYTFRACTGGAPGLHVQQGLHGRDARAYMFSRMLSIRRVVPTNAATATNAPCETSSTGSRVSGLTISK